MSYVQMKVAKPTEKDMDECYRFLRIMEALTDNRMFHSASPSDWTEWDEEDEDYKLLDYCKQRLIDEECYDEYDIEDIDHRLVLWEYVKWFFNRCPSAFARVLMCSQMALDNCFDEESDTIEWRKDISEAIEKYNKISENEA